RHAISRLGGPGCTQPFTTSARASISSANSFFASGVRSIVIFRSATACDSTLTPGLGAPELKGKVGDSQHRAPIKARRRKSHFLDLPGEELRVLYVAQASDASAALRVSVNVHVQRSQCRVVGDGRWKRQREDYEGRRRGRA